MGALEGQPILDSNEWEKIERGGDPEIKAWIARQIKSKDWLVVLVGSGTAGRKWVKYEIDKAWNDGLGVVGIYVHGLVDPSTGQSTTGANPVPATPVGSARTPLSSIVQIHDTPFTSSDYVYVHIKDNLTRWVDAAIAQRKRTDAVDPDDRRKHLEFVQTVIGRHAGNSFLVKGWALTVATVAFSFAVKERAWPVAVFGVLAVFAFWWLDGFFLRQERLYRCLYEAVIDPGRTPAVASFSMSLTAPVPGSPCRAENVVAAAR